LYFVSQLAADQVKVVLSGEGADELFGGYRIYDEPLEMSWYDKFPAGMRRKIGEIAWKFPAHRGLNFLVRRSVPLEERFIGNAYIFGEEERRSLLKHPTMAVPPAELLRDDYRKVSDADPVTKMQFIDINNWLVGDILLKADKMSMANSLELRVPFLDSEMMSIAERIPTEYKIAHGTTKYALRQAAANRLPDKWSQKDKLGFPVPIRIWLGEQRFIARLHRAFTSQCAKQFFHTNKLLKLLDDHASGRADNSRKIWTIYSFLVWYEVFFWAEIREGAPKRARLLQLTEILGDY
jgi:asparagine synthase (glutamine-hydrolysing)